MLKVVLSIWLYDMIINFADDIWWVKHRTESRDCFLDSHFSVNSVCSTNVYLSDEMCKIWQMIFLELKVNLTFRSDFLPQYHNNLLGNLKRHPLFHQVAHNIFPVNKAIIWGCSDSQTFWAFLRPALPGFPPYNKVSSGQKWSTWIAIPTQAALLGMWDGTATLEGSLVDSSKTKHSFTILSSNHVLWYLPQKSQEHTHTKTYTGSLEQLFS